MIAFLLGLSVGVFVCQSLPPLVPFEQLLRCADKRIFNIMQVYIERNNMQVELIRFRKTYWFYTRLLLRSEVFNAISPNEHNSRQWVSDSGRIRLGKFRHIRSYWLDVSYNSVFDWFRKWSHVRYVRTAGGGPSITALVTLVQQLSRDLSAPVLLKLHYPAIHTNYSVWNCSILNYIYLTPSSNLVIINQTS